MCDPFFRNAMTILAVMLTVECHLQKSFFQKQFAASELQRTIIPIKDINHRPIKSLSVGLSFDNFIYT